MGLGIIMVLLDVVVMQLHLVPKVAEVAVVVGTAVEVVQIVLIAVVEVQVT